MWIGMGFCGRTRRYTGLYEALEVVGEGTEERSGDGGGIAVMAPSDDKRWEDTRGGGSTERRIGPRDDVLGLAWRCVGCLSRDQRVQRKDGGRNVAV